MPNICLKKIWIVACLASFSTLWSTGWVEGEVEAGNRRTIGRVQTLVPVCCRDNRIAFGYARGLVDTSRDTEGNFGGGMRQMVGNLVIGGYGFFDVRYVRHDDRPYYGVSGGVEAYTRCWEARINGYVPLSGPTTYQAASAFFVGDTPQFQCLTQGVRNMPGFDAEVGYRWCCSDRPCFPEIQLFIGGYYFHRAGYETLGGPRGRALLVWNNLPRGIRFTLGVTGNGDDIQAGEVSGIARLEIPFGCRKSCPCSLCDRLFHRIDRLDTVIGHKREMCTSSAFFKGSALGSALVVDALTADVPAAIGGAGPGSFVIVDGSEGTITTNATIVMPTGQVLVGGASVLQVTGCGCGPTDLVIPGVRPTINITMASPVVSVAADATVQGLNVTNTNFAAGILASGAPRAMILDNTVLSTINGGVLVMNSNEVMLISNTITSLVEGVMIDNSDNVLISLNNITSTGSIGIAANLGAPSGVVIDRNIVSAGLAGILAGAGTADITITNNIVTNSNGGIRFDGTNTIVRNNISNSSSIGIFGSSAVTPTVEGNTITAGTDGIFIAAATTASVINNTIAQAGSIGINVTSSSSNTLIVGNTITSNGDGIFTAAISLNSIINGNTITTLTTGNGINTATIGTVQISNNALASIAGDAFFFDAGGGTVIQTGSDGNVIGTVAGSICGNNPGSGSVFWTLENGTPGFCGP
ncbi:MAG: right-handed parallel beta-helix repeat-containing protein [Parachlamydiales bacterium]